MAATDPPINLADALRKALAAVARAKRLDCEDTWDVLGEAELHLLAAISYEAHARENPGTVQLESIARSLAHLSGHGIRVQVLG